MAVISLQLANLNMIQSILVYIMIPSNIDVDFNSTKRGTPVVKATRYLATKTLGKSVRAIQQELGSWSFNWKCI